LAVEFGDAITALVDGRNHGNFHPVIASWTGL
jgi:hypothetical protein